MADELVGIESSIGIPNIRDVLGYVSYAEGYNARIKATYFQPSQVDRYLI